MVKDRRLLHVVSVSVALMAAAGPSLGQSLEFREGITPTDVYREVQAVARDIDHIRLYMGRPRNLQAALAVSGVAPREVIYQAQTLCEKTNRLSFELIREVGDKPVIPDGAIAPADVLGLVRTAHDRVRRIAELLELKLPPPVEGTVDEKTPTDVFKAVVQTNRQINLLLDQRFSPSDVYQQVSLAIAHAASVRSRWPGRRIPPAPDWELGKTPTDVYGLLLSCFDEVRQIALESNHQILELSASDSYAAQATPSDVYDIASLLVSELAYLDRVINPTASQRKARYPGRKVPSDVYQRAGILKMQLEEIRSRLQTGGVPKEGGS